MANPNLEFVRQGLILARERGFAEVELEHDGVSFKATLEAASKPKPKSLPMTQAEATPSEEVPEYTEVSAGLVGYFRQTNPHVRVGDQIAVSQVIGTVSALGLASDVESKVEGEVIEVLVEDNSPVMFGQPILRVRP